MFLEATGEGDKNRQRAGKKRERKKKKEEKQAKIGEKEGRKMWDINCCIKKLKRKRYTGIHTQITAAHRQTFRDGLVDPERLPPPWATKKQRLSDQCRRRRKKGPAEINPFSFLPPPCQRGWDPPDYPTRGKPSSTPDPPAAEPQVNP